MDTSIAIAEIRKFLGGQISLESLEDWSAVYLQDAYRNSDEAAKEVAHLLRSIINSYSDDMSEAGIRTALGNAFANKHLKSLTTTVVYPSPRAVSSAPATVRLLDLSVA